MTTRGMPSTLTESPARLNGEMLKAGALGRVFFRAKRDAAAREPQAGRKVPEILILAGGAV